MERCDCLNKFSFSVKDLVVIIEVLILRVLRSIIVVEVFGY